MDNKQSTYGIWIGIGLAFGAGIGVLCGNVALGAAFGMIIGILIASITIEQRSRKTPRFSANKPDHGVEDR